VLLAGAGGTLTVTKHIGANVTVAMAHQLGRVGYVLAGSADRFDSSWYLGIAGHGYTSLRATAFFPLYPFLTRTVGFVTGSDVIAGVLISVISFAAALMLLHRLTELELGRRAADATVLLVAFAPLSFFFSAIYTESLFLLLSVATLLAVRRERWMLAGVLGALATLTRPTGILLMVPIAVGLIRRRRRLDPRLLWSLTGFAALGSYLALLAAAGYPWTAPFQAEADWQRVSSGPLIGLAAGVFRAIKGVIMIAGGNSGPIYHATQFAPPFSASAESVLLLLVLMLGVVLVVRCLRSLPLEYGAYAALALVMCLSDPQVNQPLVSLDRYVLTIFPLWMVAGAWVAKRNLQRSAVVIGSILLVFYTVSFSSWSFIA
jgi:Dolichyl-phosphate-mannose-protein mannosyltransferase